MKPNASSACESRTSGDPEYAAISGLEHQTGPDGGIEDDEPTGVCYFCDVSLDPRYDYFCVRCDHQACDNCSQACQVQDGSCETITCIQCVDAHWQETHPDSQ